MMHKNTEPYIATYLHSKGCQLGLPIGGTFELTARCNFNCPMCYVHKNKEDLNAQSKELTAQQWIDLAKEAKNHGMVFALLTGGEPFVRQDFFEIFAAMKEMGLLVTINSNGSMLNGEIRKKLLENPPFRINISLYGGCNETYKNMCGQNAFDTVIENIRVLKKAGIDVRLNLSMTPYNQHDVERIFDISQELGVHIKASSYMYPAIRVNGENYGQGNRLSPREAAQCSVRWNQLRMNEEEYEKYAVSMKNLIAIEESECSIESNEGISCRAGRSSFWITWDGKMLPCGMLLRPESYPLKVGFNQAWEEIKRKVSEIYLPPQCSTCPKRPVCPVCAAVCLTETGYFDHVPTYVCEQTEETIQATWKSYLERMRDHEGKKAID